MADGTATTDLLVSAAITQTGGSSITKAGPGTISLTGNSNYTGGTAINEGTVISNAAGLGRGTVTVASGATLTTSSASNTGLAALYYNVGSVNQADIASLSAALAHFGNVASPALVQTTNSMNFANDGSGFPAPYNSGGTNLKASTQAS